MATKYSNPTPGDLLVHEESAIVCREGIAITNPQAAAYKAQVGHPILVDGTLAVATEEASVVGLLLETVDLAASETTAAKKAYLARGPAAINEAAIATVDSAGADFTVATIVTALAALGIVARQEPPKTSEQIN